MLEFKSEKTKISNRMLKQGEKFDVEISFENITRNFSTKHVVNCYRLKEKRVPLCFSLRIKLLLW
jgi:hypothetical protein